MRINLDWLKRHVNVEQNLSASQLAKDLVRVGLEEEEIHTSGITGPLVVGEVKSFEPEKQNNGKTINWCQVDTGEGEPRGIVCGAPNIKNDQKVVVALPGVIFPDGFKIEARKTYGHVSNGMICSERELGLSEEHNGILDISDKDWKIGENAIELLKLGKEVLEINITPDRGYCFSLRGIAREYSLSTGNKFIDNVSILNEKAPKNPNNEFRVVLDNSQKIRDRNGCSRFTTRIVEGIDPASKSPAWLQTYLTDAGMRPISLIVDISNFVMLDLGQPIHHYDLDKVKEGIVVRRAKDGETLITLDDKERKLSQEDLLITDDNGNRIIGLAGVMGGQSTEVSDSTTNVLIEAAYFDPISISRTAKRHKLPSEASKRFERGIDTNVQKAAAQLCVDLLLEYGGKDAKVSERVGDINIGFEETKISLSPLRANQIIGVEISEAEIVKILENVGCYLNKTNDSFEVTTPSWRPDLNIEEDLIEEIARVFGYDKIPSILPARKFENLKNFGIPRNNKAIRNISNALSIQGFNETITYPFVGKKDFENMLIDKNDYRAEVVRLANPIAEQSPFLRTQLLQTLLNAAKLNQSRNNESFKLFEIGTVFYPPKSKMIAPSFDGGYKLTKEELGELNKAIPLQPLKLAGVLCGKTKELNPLDKQKDTSWIDAIKTIEIISNSLSTNLSLENGEATSEFHPFRFATIATDRKEIGSIGELHPKVCDNFGLPKHSVVFEINLNALFIDLDSSLFEVQEISKFPAAKQDFSVLVPNNILTKEALELIQNVENVELEKVEIMDIFESEQFEDSRSITFSLSFRSVEKTLSPEQQLSYRNHILDYLKTKNITLRN